MSLDFILNLNHVTDYIFGMKLIFQQVVGYYMCFQYWSQYDILWDW